MVPQCFLHKGLAAGLLRQQGPYCRQHTAHQVPHWHQREADVGEELSGVGCPLGSLAEPLQGGLEQRLLAVVLDLMMMRGAQRLLTVASHHLMILSMIKKALSI